MQILAFISVNFMTRKLLQVFVTSEKNVQK